jgi:hypothetical protein
VPTTLNARVPTTLNARVPEILVDREFKKFSIYQNLGIPQILVDREFFKFSIYQNLGIPEISSRAIEGMNLRTKRSPSTRIRY